MRPDAGRTIFDSLFRVTKTATAVFPQAVQRAVAEDTAERVGICPCVAGKVFTILILKEIIIWHILPHPVLSNGIKIWYYLTQGGVMHESID